MEEIKEKLQEENKNNKEESESQIRKLGDPVPERRPKPLKRDDSKKIEKAASAARRAQLRKPTEEMKEQ